MIGSESGKRLGVFALTELIGACADEAGAV